MSFILDALKKSENDRQRQSGPALFEVRVPPPRSKFPLLAVAIVALLVVNLGVVGWLMLRKPAAAAAQVAAPQPGQPDAPPAAYAGQPVAPTQAAPGVQSAPLETPAGAYATGPATGRGYPPPDVGNANGGHAPPNAGYSSAGAGYPPAAKAGYEGSLPQDPMLADEVPAASPLNPDDYEPARDPNALRSPGVGGAIRSTDSGLPTYEEAASRTPLPALHMDLHSYAAEPAKRFVLINMKRLYEGQSLPDGAKVESITNDAAIMSYNGTRFVLDRD